MPKEGKEKYGNRDSKKQKEKETKATEMDGRMFIFMLFPLQFGTNG